MNALNTFVTHKNTQLLMLNSVHNLTRKKAYLIMIPGKSLVRASLQQQAQDMYSKNGSNRQGGSRA